LNACALRNKEGNRYQQGKSGFGHTIHLLQLAKEHDVHDANAHHAPFAGNQKYALPSMQSIQQDRRQLSAPPSMTSPQSVPAAL
jgi:hypothetical protein